MTYAYVNAMISIDDIKDHIEPHIESMAKLAMDAEITKQFETIQAELEGILKNYIKDVMEGRL